MSNIIHHGGNIQYFRKRMNLSQETLAAILGGDWTQPKISNIEKEPRLDIRVIREFAVALGIKTEDILTLETPHMRIVQKNYDFTNHPAQYIQPGSISPDKYIEAVEKNEQLSAEVRKLMAELLQSERDKNALEREKNELLAKRLNEIENSRNS
jgi:transcriptional regulator with XRE-family HTH domain